MKAVSMERAQKRGWTKARAVLAGGLVLGVGAAITLAAWTDTEFARGVFGSGKFGIEGSTDGGGSWASHVDSANAAALNFSVGADKLSKNDVVYARFAVRLTQDSTNKAAVAITQDDTAKIAGTTAQYKFTTGATCDATAFNDASSTTGTSFNLTALNTPVYLCFKVSADNSLQQGQTGSILWQFAATSTAAI